MGVSDYDIQYVKNNKPDFILFSIQNKCVCVNLLLGSNTLVTTALVKVYRLIKLINSSQYFISMILQVFTLFICVQF